MIRVTLAKEPKDFDRKVRQKGLSAIDELVGRKPRVPHRGPTRPKIAQQESEIPPDAFPPYWRDCLDEMIELYERRCAYTALHLEHGTGSPTVDHAVPKSKKWKLVYEWSNYRLCSALFNSKKQDAGSIVDPFIVSIEWFELEFVGFQVKRSPNAPLGQHARIDATLPMLNINDFRKAREAYVREYDERHIDFDYLQRRAPFVALELRRQGRLRPEDR